MLAIDQRESLRHMLATSTGAPVDDIALSEFKTLVVRELSPHASGVLLDRDYGMPAARISHCPLILAADILSQSVPGGPVDTARLDPEVTPEFIAESGAVALKMLVPWTPERRPEAIELTSEFLELCRRAGLPGIVEGVVRPVDIADWSDRDRDHALVLAARDLGALGPELYKGEVPSYGRADAEVITSAAREITESIECPWVVLSSGVAAADFPRAVAACVAGGAEGFLAGRAIWADALAASDPAAFLAHESVDRLRGLAEGEEP
jgi:sulfofructosephosphate aldolase